MTTAIRTDAEREVKVWDPLVRIVHWSVAVLFLLNFALLEEGEFLHRLSGYAILTLVSVRLAWGVVGTRHARFGAFPPSLGAARAHVRDLLAGKRTSHLSHNPLGALMAYALWTLLILIAAAGMSTHAGIVAEETGEEIHELLANIALVAILIHIAGAVGQSLFERVNLVGAMITGNKTLPPRAEREN